MLLSIFGYPFPKPPQFSIEQELRNFQDRESRPAAMIQSPGSQWTWGVGSSLLEVVLQCFQKRLIESWAFLNSYIYYIYRFVHQVNYGWGMVELARAYEDCRLIDSYWFNYHFIRLRGRQADRFVIIQIDWCMNRSKKIGHALVEVPMTDRLISW